jgi:nitrile hydratase
MNGVHDMGGMQGFGPIDPEPGEPVFHAPWEARVYGLCAAVGAVGDWTLDADRHATESIAPHVYLSVSYYEKWFLSLRRLLLENGYLSEAELVSGKLEMKPKPVDGALKPALVEDYVHSASLSSRPAEAEPDFAVGQSVRARNINPPGHTRLPRYARGHAGTIDRIHGCHVFPDSNAHGEGEQPRWLYSVRFTAQELWGAGQPSKTDIYVDLWEPYLEPA